jgi:hypothetical protein
MPLVRLFSGRLCKILGHSRPASFLSSKSISLDYSQFILLLQHVKERIYRWHRHCNTTFDAKVFLLFIGLILLFIGDLQICHTLILGWMKLHFLYLKT